jgi:hypothetical protein
VIRPNIPSKQRPRKHPLYIPICARSLVSPSLEQERRRRRRPRRANGHVYGCAAAQRQRGRGEGRLKEHALLARHFRARGAFLCRRGRVSGTLVRRPRGRHTGSDESARRGAGENGWMECTQEEEEAWIKQFRTRHDRSHARNYLRYAAVVGARIERSRSSEEGRPISSPAAQRRCDKTLCQSHKSFALINPFSPPIAPRMLNPEYGQDGGGGKAHEDDGVARCRGLQVHAVGASLRAMGLTPLQTLSSVRSRSSRPRIPIPPQSRNTALHAQKMRVQVWLFEQTGVRLEGRILVSRQEGTSESAPHETTAIRCFARCKPAPRLQSE